MKKKLALMAFAAGTVLAAVAAPVERPQGPANGANGLPEWQQADALRLGQVTPHTLVVPYPNGNMHAIADMQYAQSPYYMSLNGQWKFHWNMDVAKRPVGFQEPAYDVSQWEEILVPANWETQGYANKVYVNTTYEFDSEYWGFPKNPPVVPAESNQVGSYRRQFTVPAAWAGRRVVIALEGVSTFYYIWVNGTYLGYNQDSKVPAEWDITDLLRPDGENTVALEVYRWASGSYVECQDFWRLAGIERDVYLYSTPQTYVADFTVLSPLDATYTDGLLSVNAQIQGLPQPQAPAKGKKAKKAPAGAEPQKPYTLSWMLYAPDGIIVANGKQELPDQQGASSCTVDFGTTIPAVQAWSAEHPNLYTLAMELKDPQGNVTETVGCNVGFKTSEIKGSDLLVNGKRVMIKGANRHSHSNDRGRYVSPETEMQDIVLMKQNNINTVRNCHYPADRLWYHLADKYGLYVVDEANFESHGMGYGPEALAKDTAWMKPMMDRNLRMWEKSKNNPSVTIYSMGNESGNGVTSEETYKMMKQLVKDRPIWWERALNDWNSDIFGEMYRPIETLKEYSADPSKTRPYILIEYAHAMGNSVGSLKDYWETIETLPKLQGGCIWDWVDQSFVEKDPQTGVEYFTYGGDYGPKNIPSDNSFCCNGLINSDRTAHPHLSEVKAVYRYAKTKADDLGALRFTTHNWHDFTNLSAYTLNWQVVDAEGKVYAEGVKDLDVAPGQSGTFTLDEAVPSIPVNHPELLVNLSWTLDQANGLLPKGYEMGFEQFVIPSTLPAPAPLATAKVKSLKNGNYKAGNVAFSVDAATGALTALSAGGKQLLARPLTLSLYRPLTENDAHGNGSGKFWRKAGLDGVTFAATAAPKVVKNVVTCPVNVLGREGNVIGTALLRYSVKGDNTLSVGVDFAPDTAVIKRIPRVGLTFRMTDADCPSFTWIGHDKETYIDRDVCGVIGRHASTPAQQQHRYIKPGACGNHTQTREVNIDGGEMVVTRADGTPFQFSITPYDDKNVDAAMHINELKADGMVTLHFDAAQTGVGTATCGPDIRPEYLLPIEPYSFTFDFKLK